MHISKEGLEFLIKEEGFKIKPYKDSKGLWTVGVGHLLTPSELSSGKIKNEKYKLNKSYKLLDSEDIKVLLKIDLERFEDTINSHELPLSQNQYDALLSFTFNIGVSAFEKSTLLKYLKSDVNNTSNISSQLLRWVHPSELLGRRKREISLYLHGKYK